MTKVTPTFSEVFFEESAFAMGKYKDVKIILSDDPRRPEYHLHKVILAAHSSFFRKLFRQEPKDVYEIGAVSKRGFESVMFYWFTGSLVLNNYVFDDTMRAALYLGCEKIEAMMKKVDEARIRAGCEILVKVDTC